MRTTYGVSLSHEWLYQMIWADKRSGGDLWRFLRRQGKQYTWQGAQQAGRGVIPHRIDILPTGSPLWQPRPGWAIGRATPSLASDTKGPCSPMSRTQACSQPSQNCPGPRRRQHTGRRCSGSPLCATTSTPLPMTTAKSSPDTGRPPNVCAPRCSLPLPIHAWERGVNEHTKT